MNNKWQVALIIPYALLLQSCAPLELADVIVGLPGSSEPRPIQGFECERTLRPSDLASIQTIAILKIPEPPNYGRDAKHSSPNAKYGDLSFGSTAQASLKRHLEDKGFEVIEYSPTRENEYRLIDDYSSIDVKGADAYLDVVPIEVAYKFRAYKSPVKIRPLVSASFRLVSTSSNETIYAGSVQYGWKEQYGWNSVAGVKIESPEEHKYESSETLKANKKEASAWLIQGIEAVSFSIAKKIVKREFEPDLNNSDLSENGPDFTGTYTSTITGQTQSLNIKGRNLEVKLTQNGKNISGTFDCNRGFIWGEIEDGNIGFKYQSSDGSTGTGKWTVKPDSKEITGKWNSSRTGEGDWNLVRIE